MDYKYTLFLLLSERLSDAKFSREFLIRKAF